jgi:hypothetical protein
VIVLRRGGRDRTRLVVISRIPLLLSRGSGGGCKSNEEVTPVDGLMYHITLKKRCFATVSMECFSTSAEMELYIALVLDLQFGPSVTCNEMIVQDSQFGPSVTSDDIE